MSGIKEAAGGVCAPKGFMAGGVHAGVKASSKKRDLALVYSEKPCSAAAMFTTNTVKAASVIVSREHLSGGTLRAIIANSGNANACTGDAGLAAARRMTELAADILAVPPEEVAVASTGVIGVPLPIRVIEDNIAALKNSLRGDEAGSAAALEAIMTTDTRKKEAAVEIEIDGRPVRIGGMVKGSGMIHPNMATMLGFITTDAAVSREALDLCLGQAVARSFNRVTVDGDTSTNDTVIIMANGEAGNSRIEAGSAGETGAGSSRGAESSRCVGSAGESCAGDSHGAENSHGSDSGISAFEKFSRALTSLCVKLARMMARDGEGATKLVTVTVSGAESEAAAETLARAVASSSLVKAACFGADANWGRILCAMGYSGAAFSPGETDVAFASGGEEIAVCSGGTQLAFSEEDAKRILGREEIEIRVKAGGGEGNATVWGCDLTYDYVKINGDYRS